MWDVLPDSTRWIDGTAAWLLTYLLHSTLLLGAALMVSRRLPDRFLPLKEIVWRSALVGGLLTATLQLGLGIEPLAGSWQVGHGTASAADSAVPGPGGATDLLPAASRLAATGPPAPAPAAAFIPAVVARSSESSGPAHALCRWLLTGWSLIAAALLALIVVSYVRLIRRLDSRRPLTDGPVPALLSRLVDRVAARPAHLAASTEIAVPIARGIRQREICLPQRVVTTMAKDQLEIVLAHELAHLERRDPLWLLAMRAVESLFFFQPLNRLARRDLQEIAEFRCDDWAVSRTGRPVGMARCLTDVAGWRLDRRLPELIPMMAVDRSQLGRRVSRLLARDYPAPAASTPRWMGVAATLLLALVAVVAPGVSRATVSPSADPEVSVLGADQTEDSVAPEAPTAPRAAPVTAPVAPMAPVAPTAPLPATPPAADTDDFDVDQLEAQLEARLAVLEVDLEPLQLELDRLTSEISRTALDSIEIERLAREASALAAGIEIPEQAVTELERRALALTASEPLTPEQQKELNRLADDVAQMAIRPEIAVRLNEIGTEIGELARPDPEILARINEIAAEIARAYQPSTEEIRQLVSASSREAENLGRKETDRSDSARLPEVSAEENPTEPETPGADEPLGTWEESGSDSG